MNPTLELNFWTQLLGILALEVVAIVAIAFLAQTLTRSTFWRRTIWQISFVCVLLMAGAELTGVGRGVSIWLAGKPVPERTVSVRMVPTDEQFAVPSDAIEFPEPVFVPQKETPVARSIWWPGVLWLAGFGLIVARILFARVLFFALRWRNREIDDLDLLRRVSQLAIRLGIRRRIHLLESSGLTSPVAFGIVRLSIGLPHGLAHKFTAKQQDAMLTHELAHLAGRDPLWYLLADFTAAIFWWHPAIWCARRRLHSVSEHAADEAAAVLDNGPGILAECLVQLGQQLSRTRSFGWLGVEGNGFRSHLGQRVERLLNLKEPRKEKLRGWQLFFAKTTFTIFVGGLAVFTSGWIQGGKEQQEKNLSTAVQKSWNGSFASTALAALAVERKELLAKDEKQTTSRTAKLPLYDDLAFETLIYNNVSYEEFQAFCKTLAPEKLITFENITVHSNYVVQVLGALSTLKEHLVAPQDFVGSKFSRMHLTYQGNPTNNGNNCTYFTETKDGLRVVTGAEMAYQTTNTWSFSVVPQKQDDLIEIEIAWRDGSKDVTKQFKMPKDGVSVWRRDFSDDPSHHQVIVFSPARLPRKENSGNEKTPEQKKANRPRAELIYPTIPLKTVENSAPVSPNVFISRERTNLASTSKGRQAIKAKLDRIRFSEVEFQGMPMGEVLKSLSAESKRQDSENVGINFIFDPHLGSSNSVDPNDITIHISPPLENVRLAEVLDSIVQVADKPIQYKIEDYAVVFSPTTTEALALYTRVFKLDSMKFLEKLESFPDAITDKSFDWSFPFDGNSYGDESAKSNSLVPKRSFQSVTRTNRQQTVNVKVRQFLEAAGVEFDAPGTLNGKAVFFNDRAGTLMVRATLEDLEIISTAVEVLNYQLPQITIETKFAEFHEATGRGIDWSELLSETGAQIITNADSGFEFPDKLTPTFKFLDGYTNWTKAFPTQSLSNSIARNFTTVLTDKQFRTLIKLLEGQAGTDILSPPKLTMLSGHESQVSVQELVMVQPKPDSPGIPLATGPFVNVAAHVSPDGFSIQMRTLATIKEVIHEKRGLLRKKTSIAKIRQMSGTANIFDGQTLVLGEITDAQRILFVFVTATIIDPAGNRVNNEENMPFARTSVPKQPERK